MKKVNTLRVLVYLAFALYFLQPIVKSAYERMNGNYSHYTRRQYGDAIPATLYGNFIPSQTEGRLQVNADYTLQNMKIKASVLLNKKVHPPLWLSFVNLIVAVASVTILWGVVVTINKIIVRIAGGTMFDDACISLIQKTALLLLMYALADYAYQWITYLKGSLMLHSPLEVVNTSAFSFPILICAILVYIIAEAFKQGALLKQEQELTI